MISTCLSYIRDLRFRKTHFWRTLWHFESKTFCIYFQLSLDLYYTEDEIYELSYAREPRSHRAAVRNFTPKQDVEII